MILNFFDDQVYVNSISVVVVIFGAVDVKNFIQNEVLGLCSETIS
jgi:hypothetical protein